MSNVKNAITLVSLVAGVFGAAFIFSEMGPKASANPIPSPAAVIPTIELSATPKPVPTINASPVLIVAEKPHTVKAAPAKAKIWTCGEWRNLDNDAKQMVKPCEWMNGNE